MPHSHADQISSTALTMHDFVAQLVPQIESGTLRQLFVTGTDTDVGKTFISVQILRQLQRMAPNLTIEARKPIASGCQRQPDGTLQCEDVEQLYQALNGQTHREAICAHTFEAALAPQTALHQAKQTLTTQQMAQACQTGADFTLIEGAGGFYSPLSSDERNAELAKCLKSPILLVIKDQLGCINHTLLTLEAIQNAQLPLAGILLNQYRPRSAYDTLWQLQQQPPLKHTPLYTHPFIPAN